MSAALALRMEMLAGWSTALGQTEVSQQLSHGLSCADIHGPQRMNLIDVGDQTFVVLVNHLNNYWLDCHDMQTFHVS